MIYPNDISYDRVIRKVLYLPKGEPLGKNELVFLLTNDREDSYRMINDKTNMISLNHYRYFYYQFQYYGQLNTKRYRINYLPNRKEMRNEVSEKTNLILYPNLKFGALNDKRNTFFDLSEYMKIFSVFTGNLNPVKKMEIFWSYFKSILSYANDPAYKKLMLINIDQYKNIKGSLKETINNPVFLIYYTLFRNYSLVTDIDLDIILYTGTYNLKINLKNATKTTFKSFYIELKKLYQHTSVSLDLNEESILKEEREEVVSSEMKTMLNFTGSSPLNADSSIATKLPEKKEESNDDKKIEEKIKSKVQEANKDISNVVTPTTVKENIEITKAVKTNAEGLISDDKDLIDEIYRSNQKKAIPKSVASSKRDELLRKEQENIKVKNMTIGELRRIDASHVEIPETDISSALHTTNKNVKSVKFSNFNKVYTEKVMPKDITNAFMAMNEGKELPLYIRNIKVEDTSDELNYIETYTVEFEDSNRLRSTIKVDIPKIIDNKFLWLGGNKKLIMNQTFLLPIVKTAPDTVQIVTNYNKMFVIRDEVKSLDAVEKITKLGTKNEEFAKGFTVANVFDFNKEFITTIDYDEFSKIYEKYKYKDCTIFFNQNDAVSYAEQNGIDIPSDKMFIGIRKSGPIFIDFYTQMTEDDETIADIIIENAPESAMNDVSSIKASKRLMFARVKTMEKKIPVMILICLWEGFSTVIKKMNLQYRLSDKKPNDLKASESFIRFKDVYFIYKDNAITSLMINGLRQMKTEDFTIAEMDTRDPYFTVLKKIYGKLSIANALDNTYEFTVDPITKEVLQDLNLPTDIVNILIYAVKLLADNQYTLDINYGMSRTRCFEVIPAILYDSLAKNYINYKNSNGKKKFSVPRDIVIKKLLELQTVEDYSTLNPILEMEKTHITSTKGWRGINLSDSYTPAKRAYDPSMIGIIAPTTSPDAQVGVQRVLSTEPNIKSARGYSIISDKKEYDKLTDINLFSPGEMMIPLAVTRDDPTRVGHAIKQSKHVIPIKKSSPVLISNGAEESCRFNLSSDFVINAEEDGTVVELDEKNKIMVVKYKSGNHRAINLAPNIVKNGGGGFYESMTLITNLKAGDKFKVHDVLAWNKDFFKNDSVNGCRMTMGVLTKVAITSTYNTYEDATFITNKLSRDASTEMCFQKAVVLGKNSTVSYMAKIGDEIEIGDSLVQFDSSFEDDSLNEFLNALAGDPRLENEILESSKNNIKSKVAGVIEDIKIYSTVELDQLSPSLRKIVRNYYNSVNERKKILSKYDPNGSVVKCGMLMTDTSSTSVPNKFGVIRGQKVEDSVLIEFYIKHTELLEVGSKIANFTGLKNTIGEIIPEGFEPYSDFRKDEEVGSIIASNSILKRMVPSILLSTLANKCIVELRRKLVDIWTDSKSISMVIRRKQMCDVIYKFFSAYDTSGTNTKKYKDMFEPMSDAKFKSFFDSFVANEDMYLILDVVDYEHTIRLEDIKRAAKSIDIPLFEYVYMPHITMNKNIIISTPEPVPVGYIHIKRTQQTVMKKNGLSTDIDQRSAMTGQVTGSDKNGRETDLENTLLLSTGLVDTLKELNGPRADDIVMKNEMLREIAANGFVRYSDLSYDISNKTTLNTINTFLLGMGIKSDLVNKGLMLSSTLKDELK